MFLITETNLSLFDSEEAIFTNVPAPVAGKPLLPKCQSCELVPALSKFPEIFSSWSITLNPGFLMGTDLLDATLSHNVCRNCFSLLWIECESHYAKNVLNVALDSCGCNFVAGKNEEEPLACDQPALQRLLSNALGNTAQQPCNLSNSQIPSFPKEPHFRAQQRAMTHFFSFMYLCAFLNSVIIFVYAVMQYYRTNVVYLVPAMAADSS